MNLADIRKRHGLDEKKTEQKSTTQTTASHMLDEIRTRHNLGKVTSTREKVEVIKAKPKLYENELDYFVKANYQGGKDRYEQMQQQSAGLAKELENIKRETYSGARKGTHYTDWVRGRTERQAAKQSELDKLNEQLSKWDEYYGKDSTDMYKDIANAEDFEEKSKAKTPEYIEQNLSGIDLMLSDEFGQADTVYNYINNIGRNTPINPSTTKCLRSD